MAGRHPAAKKKLPIPRLLTTAYTTKTVKAKQTSEEKQAKKREFYRARDKSRINIGASFQRWRELRELKGFKTDAEMAAFLLDSLKEEQEEVRIGPAPVCVKREDDEEKPRPPRRAQEGGGVEPPAGGSAECMETDGEDCGRPEPARNSEPHSRLQAETDDGDPESSETEVSDEDWTRTPETDVQHLLVIKEEFPPELSPSVDQEPENMRLKEEQEEVRIGPADETRFPLTPVCVKREDEEEKPRPPRRAEEGGGAEPPAGGSAKRMETDGEDCGRPEPARNSEPHSRLQPETDDGDPESSETEVSDEDWTRTPETGL